MIRCIFTLISLLAWTCSADAQPPLVRSIQPFSASFFGIVACIPFNAFIASPVADPTLSPVDPLTSNTTEATSMGTYPPAYPPAYPPLYPNLANTTASTLRNFGWAEITAEKAIIDSLNFTIYAGELSLSLSNTTTSLSSNRTINITIIPAGDSQLTYYVQNLGAGDLILAPGSVNTSGSFLISTKSSGGVTASGLNVSELMIESSGTNTISVNGSFPSASVTSDGLTSVVLAGINPDQGKVSVQASGISNIYVAGGQGTLITGRVSSPSRVYYSGGGDCSVASSVPLLVLGFPIGGSACSPSTTLPLGINLHPAAFTCGINVSTTPGSTCFDHADGGQGSSSYSFSSGGGSSSSSSTSGGGEATSSSSDGSGTTYTNGGTAISSLPCIDGPPVLLV